MGREAPCTCRYGGKSIEGKALLETDALIFRSAEKPLSIPFRSIEALHVVDGELYVAGPHGEAVFVLGSQAAKWEARIRNPPGRDQKLGLKPGQRILVVGDVGISPSGSAPYDHVFLEANGVADLGALVMLKEQIEPNGSIWVVRPKGQKALTENDVIRIGRESGLVDTKVVAFSPTHSALKLVIPLAARASR